MKNNAEQSLYDLLITQNLEPEILDSAGKPVTDPSKAELFSFDYVTENQDYGTVVILIGDNNQLEVYFGDNLGRGMEANDKSAWYDFLHQLKSFASRNMMTFGLNNIARLKYTMKGMAAIKEGLFEGYYGRKNISYSDQPKQVRLMIKHNRNIDEGEARYRAIESLFVETAEGERFKLPFRNLMGGRIMARHVSEGGTPYDAFGQHIVEVISEIGTLSRFIRATRGKQFAGHTDELVEIALRHYSDLKDKAKRMISHRGYLEERDMFDPAEISESSATTDVIRDLFIEQNVDQRIEEALPILAQLANKKEDKMREANEFESWANQVMEGTWALPDTPKADAKLKELMSKPLIVGADATNATEQLYDLVGDDVLFDRLNDLADADPTANCWDDEEVINRLGELGIDTSMGSGEADADGDAEALADPEMGPQTQPELDDQMGESDLNLMRRRAGIQQGVAEMWGNPYDDDKVDAINAANPPKTPSGQPNRMTPTTAKHTASAPGGRETLDHDEWDKFTRGVAEDATQLNVQQLATISDAALDKAYGYGRSQPGNSFGWQANLKSAAFAKQIIDKGVTEFDNNTAKFIEAISDAIHKGWNTTAQAFVQNPEQFDDTAKLKAAGKLEAKLQQRAQLMKQSYGELPEEEKEKDRVVARALLQALKGEQGVAEDWSAPPQDTGGYGDSVRKTTGGNTNVYKLSQLLKDPSVESYIKMEVSHVYKPSNELIQGIKSKKWEGWDTGPSSIDGPGGWFIKATNPMYFKEFLKALSQSVTDDRQIRVSIDPYVKNARAKNVEMTEDSFDSPVASAITRRILMQRADLLEKYGPVAVTQAIDDVADFVGDVDEIGSSDVSGWIKQVEQSLGRVDEGELNLMRKRAGIQQGVTEGNGDTEIRPGMRVSQGTVVKVNGNTVTVKTSNGDMMNMNIHDVDQAVTEGQEDKGILDTVKKIGNRVFDKLGGGSDEDLLNNLRKDAGLPPRMAVPNKKDVGEDLDTDGVMMTRPSNMSS